MVTSVVRLAKGREQQRVDAESEAALGLFQSCGKGPPRFRVRSWGLTDRRCFFRLGHKRYAVGKEGSGRLWPDEKRLGREGGKEPQGISPEGPFPSSGEV